MPSPVMTSNLVEIPSHSKYKHSGLMKNDTIHSITHGTVTFSTTIKKFVSNDDTYNLQFICILCCTLHLLNSENYGVSFRSIRSITQQNPRSLMKIREFSKKSF